MFVVTYILFNVRFSTLNTSSCWDQPTYTRNYIFMSNTDDLITLIKSHLDRRTLKNSDTILRS